MTTGSFEVDTKRELGYEFKNPSNEDITYTFTPSGKWMPAKAEMGIPECGPEGIKQFPEQYQKMLKYPNNTAFALLLVNPKTNEVKELAKETKMTLKPGETLTFVVNDVEGTYNDNSGTLAVNWAAENTQPSAPSEQLKATIYEHGNFQGASQELTEGSYNIA
ncbi:hypothetical protein, partial [Phormidium sp. CCY1219]|uniref:hypothetical protein n=1 Tax=Phormidium sp. CCY1219 TaxID=2886104 RepID=UPI002D1F6559